MAGANPLIDAYVAQLVHWKDEIAALRALLLAAGLDEAYKWRQPCYGIDGSNVAILHGMRAYCGIGFLKGSLLDDPSGLLVSPGPNSRASRQVRVTSLADIERDKAAIRALIDAAIATEKAGLKVDFSANRHPDLPQELIDRMDADPDFAAAFQALTPGRQRGYAIHVSGAKQSATRSARIDKHAARIFAGKGLHDR
jgi:uncharacterized protein YdeI (YjbR/CyaY-like superfamily)